ncbi:MAG: pilus assembly protein [Cellulomonadaceae bacterium]|jgi:hypothetical protein|nr:pilus assembly protein [Cellulomonadaceae bacterium]
MTQQRWRAAVRGLVLRRRPAERCGTVRPSADHDDVERGDAEHAVNERGSVTAEMAVGMPAIVLLLVVVLTVGAAANAHLRAADAARVGARLVAVGESHEEVSAAVARIGGSGAQITVHREGAFVSVEVTRSVAGGISWGGPLRATGRATAWVEP